MMKKTIHKYLSLFLIIFLFILPIFVHSQEVGGTGLTYECAGEPGSCTFDDLVAATRKVVNELVKYALLFSVIVLVYAGFTYLTSGGNSGKLAKANKMFLSVGIGIVFIIAAWLIVNLVSNALTGQSLLRG